MGCEVSWFAALCDDDYEFLGVPDPALQSSWEHCRTIALAAEAGGYDNLLLPSGYALGIDAVGFAAGIAPLLRRMQLLVAVRTGEMWAPQLARQLATLDQMLGGRLTVNIISSDLPGQKLDSVPRYQRTLEIMSVLRDLLDGKPVDFHGEFVDVTLDPPRLRPKGGCPPFYFGGLSEPAREVAAQAADVFLMWPDTLPGVSAVIEDMRARAARHGRELRFGYRAHVIVRPTEAEARVAARRLLSRLDAETGEQIRRRSLDTTSAGNARQRELREVANSEGYAEPQLWTGIGRARSGAGAAIVGDPDQVLAKLRAYQALGMEAFILSGYPHVAEGDLFARHVLSHLPHAPLFPRLSRGGRGLRRRFSADRETRKSCHGVAAGSGGGGAAWVAVAGSGQQVGDDAGGGLGDGREERGLVHGRVPQDLDVEPGEQLGLDVLGQLVQAGGQFGRLVQQIGVMGAPDVAG